MIKKKININISEIVFESIEPDQSILTLWKRGHKFSNQGAIISQLSAKNVVKIDIQCTLFVNGFDSKIKSKYIEFYTFRCIDNQYVPWIRYQFDLSKVVADGQVVHLSQSDAKGTKLTICFVASLDGTKVSIPETMIPALDETVEVIPEVKEEKPTLKEVEKKVEVGEQILKMKLL